MTIRDIKTLRRRIMGSCDSRGQLLRKIRRFIRWATRHEEGGN
jgi:hypothetical protein